MKEIPFLWKYIFVLSVFLLSVKCEEWECGNDCKAILEDGVLTVKGNGAMNDFSFSSSSIPWYSSQKLINSVVIEDGITTIGSYAFEECSSLTSISIPNSATAIGVGAFERCSSLSSIAIPESITKIGNNAFLGCSKLTSIFIPKNIRTISSGVFSGCSSLSTITVDEENNYFKVIDNILFTKDGTKLIRYAPAKTDTFYSVPDDVIGIDAYAFNGCSHLETINILNSEMKIGNYAFNGCTSLTSGKIGTIEWKLDKETGEMTFTGEGDMMIFVNYAMPWHSSRESIKKVTISEGIITISNSAFYKCSSLTSIIIQNSVTTFEGNAFSYCSSLTSITIPDSVTTIGGGAFSSCSSLTQGTFGLVEWSLNKETNELKFTGKGKMPNFGSDSATPWYSSGLHKIH